MNNRKIRVVLLFGGRSAEHEVSLLSARNVLRALDPDRHEPVLIGIDKQGVWRRQSESSLQGAVGNPRNLALAPEGEEVEVPLSPRTDGKHGTGDQAVSPFEATDQQIVVFPVLHGTYGEDGTVQGLLDLAGLPYVGAGTLGSAVAMDKDVSKRLLAQAGIPVVPWRCLRNTGFQKDPDGAERTAAELGFPLFVKPCNAGSSVGVHKVKVRAGLPAALADAFRFDDKVLIEAAVDAREIECAVLGNDEPEASIPGEIVVTHPDGFYSYDAKYVDADGSHVEIPANVPASILQEVRRLAVEAFRTLELSGLARIDFFLDRHTDRVYLNEANTMPGFTAISMYPKMWEAAGVSQTQLVSRLIDLALQRHQRRQQMRTTL